MDDEIEELNEAIEALERKNDALVDYLRTIIAPPACGAGTPRLR